MNFRHARVACIAAAVTALSTLLPIVPAAAADAAQPVVQNAQAVPTCVHGVPAAFITFDYLGAGSSTRFLILRYGTQMAEVVGVGSGRAAVQLGAQNTTYTSYTVRAENDPWGGVHTSTADIATCDNWNGVDGYIFDSNQPIGWVNRYEGRTIRGGMVYPGEEYGALYVGITGTHVVRGAIFAEYGRQRWENGQLGWPTTSEFGYAQPTYGYYTNFQNGTITWSPNTGARAVVGEIYRAWGRLGYERSPLGLPTTSESSTPGGAGAYSHFQNGSIYWSPSTGAHSVRGAILGTWSRLGWEQGWLGFPQSDEYQSGEFRRSDFEGGYILWSPGTGAVAHRW